MPFLACTIQDVPAYINIDHIVGMHILLGADEEAVVKLFATRSELDQTFEFESEEDAVDFIRLISDFIMNHKQDFLVVQAKITTDEV